jgi:flagellar export protein FliJ
MLDPTSIPIHFISNEMKAFKFNLQSLLQLRNQIKEQLFQNWATSAQALQKTIQEKERLEGQLHSWQENYRKNYSQAVPVLDFWREQRAASVLQHHLLEQDRARQHLDNRTRQALQAWQEARRKEEVLERLKGRAKMDWVRDYERQEQKLSDERASSQAMKRLGEVLPEIRGESV